MAQLDPDDLLDSRPNTNDYDEQPLELTHKQEGPSRPKAYTPQKPKAKPRKRKEHDEGNEREIECEVEQLTMDQEVLFASSAFNWIICGTANVVDPEANGTG